MPSVSLRHRTRYRYRNPVALAEHRMMLRPAEGFDQRLVSFDLEISPKPGMLREVHDLTGAAATVARFEARCRELTVESRALVEHLPVNALDLEVSCASVGAAPFAYEPDEAAALGAAIRCRHEDAGELTAWARSFVRPVGQTHLSTLLSDMTHAIRAGFAYQLRREGPAQSPGETLALRRGSCRDFAWLQVEAARRLGLAALFVTGYVYSASAKATGPGHGHTHAWARVYVPGCGWVDFDPTNGIVGNAGLIRVACAPDPRLVVPLHGSWRGMRSDFLGMDVEVAIATLDEASAQPGSASGVAQLG
jgi:transglutaminase-like putative cysteine protease